ncbi:MAG: ferritin-like domain-containing protein [Deltaproteobacteria bacterium]|nr:ferritin-like domain-containing protein [Deltaproteobacteria bacterium]
MPLQNFGSILNFAEKLESLDRQFYAAACGNSACAGYKALFAELEAEAARHVTTVQRLRRENVTEMILEPVQDFTRASFCEACEGAAVLSASEVLATAKRLEARAERYYAEAAEKLQALTEVSRALKALGKNRKARQAKLTRPPS